MIALVVGPDAALARAEVARLLALHDPSGLNATRLDGKTAMVDDVIVAVGTPGFFGSGRVVVVDDLMGRASKASSVTGESDAIDGQNERRKAIDFARLFAAVPPENALILVDQGLSTVPSSVKKAIPSGALIFGGEPPRGAELIAWIQRRTAEAGSTIDGRAARLLAERLFPQTWTNKPTNPAFDRPPDLDLLGNAVEILSLAAYPGAIDVESVRALVPSAGEDRLFPFIEAAVTNRLEEAIPALEGLQTAGDDSGRLSAQILQQIELAAVVAEADPTADPVMIGKTIGLPNPNRMIGVAKTVRRGRLSPRSAVRLALDTERRAKRGGLRQSADVLYHLLTASAVPTTSERE